MKLSYLPLLLSIAMSLTHAGATEITRIDISEFGGDTLRFYQEFASAPVIVTGAYASDEFLNSLSLAQIEEDFKGKALFGYSRKNDANGRIREDIPSESFFADLKEGASNYYVFDHAVSDTPFTGKVNVPPFLDDNWLDDSFGFNITLSGKGSFTPFHEDGSGEQAWMYLVMGEKHWTIYPPKCRPLLWDSLFKDFYNPMKSDSKRFPFVSCGDGDKITAIAKSGDLIFLPPGWLHQVVTTEVSFGLGGNIFNEFQAYASTETALNEKSHALRHDLDLFELLSEKEKSVRTQYGMSQVQEAVKLTQEWLSRVRNKSDILLPRIAGTGASSEIGKPID